MSASDEQILDELMARNEQVVKSAKDVLEETKKLLEQVSKQERCRNLEFQMSSTTNNEDIQEYKTQFLLDLKRKREKKNGTNTIDFNAHDEPKKSAVESVTADITNTSKLPTETQNIMVTESEETHSSTSLCKVSETESQTFVSKDKEIKHVYNAHDALIYPRAAHVDVPYHCAPVQPFYQPVILLPPDYCMYKPGQIYQPLQQQYSIQQSDYLRNSKLNYEIAENTQSGSDDELNGTRIIMKNKKTGYLCNVCGKIYCRKYVLKIHQRVHSGEKPLICQICGKCFSDPSNLKKHIKLHDPETSLIKCRLCPRQYTRRRSLINHMTSFHHLTEDQIFREEDISSDEIPAQQVLTE